MRHVSMVSRGGGFMRVAMHQPHYLPWLGYIDKIDRADLFVFLDHVQFERSNWQNRNYVKSASGPVLLTVPVSQGLEERIIDKVIDDRKPWRRKHRRTIEHAYHGGRHWRRFADTVLGVYDKPWTHLADLAIESVTILLEPFGITTPLIRSSGLGDIPGRKTEMIAQVCEAVGATTFLSGDTARDYLDVRLLNDRGIDVEWQSFVHPDYEQQHPRIGFVPRMAAVDLLLNEGGDGYAKVRAAQRSGRAVTGGRPGGAVVG